MNPLVKKAFEQINHSLADLEDIIDTNKLKIKKQEKDREADLKENWRRKKEIAILQQGRQQFEELATEHKKLAENQKSLKEHLKRLLECTKALNSELRS